MNTMTAMVLSDFGPPENLEAATVERPAPASDQVLVCVRACGVCGHDLLARQGKLGTRLPMILGHEIAGVVAEVGDEVRSLTLGQRVALVQRIPCGGCAQCLAGVTNLCRSGPGFYGDDLPGGYAEYVVASEHNVVPLPETIDFTTGAVLSCGVGTGLRALRAAELSPGDTVVVTGAGGGVGLHTVKVAAALGYRVLAVSGSPHKYAAILAAGAERVVAPSSRFAARDAVRESFGVRGAAAAIEITGMPTFDMSLAALAGGGRLVLVGNTDPAPLTTNPGIWIVRELKLVGSAHATRADLAEVVDLVDSGRVSVEVATVRELREAAEVHQALERREIAGRAVLKIQGIR